MPLDSSSFRLQWNRSSEAAETRAVCLAQATPCRLQWNRSSEAAETLDEVGKHVSAEHASMEPQLRGCGNQKRPEHPGWGRQRFNGTAAQRLRKRARLRDRGSGDRSASMEPQLRGCGNSDDVYRTLRIRAGFNGTAAQRLRKLSSIDSGARVPYGLQWNRSSEAAETPCRCATTWPKLWASMEPQLRGCGNWCDTFPVEQYSSRFNGTAAQRLRKPAAGRTRPAADLRRFNGTAAQRLRKLPHPLHHVRVIPGASMEPQLRGCGNDRHPGCEVIRLERLQWNRSSEAAETGGDCIVVDDPHNVASMEPQLRGCGNKNLSPTHEPAATCFNGTAAQRLRKPGHRYALRSPEHVASMEPQLRGCGNFPLGKAPRTRSAGFNGTAAQRLRKPSAAGLRSVAGCGCFNGTAAQRLRKPALWGSPHSVVGFSFRVERAEGSGNATGIALRAPQALFTLSRCSQECFCLGECDIVAMKAVAPL
jgi:hypothetical protein